MSIPAKHSLYKTARLCTPLTEYDPRTGEVAGHRPAGSLVRVEYVYAMRDGTRMYDVLSMPGLAHYVPEHDLTDFCL